MVLTLRDHSKLYKSLSSLFCLYSEGSSWPMSWLNWLLATPFPFLRMEGSWRSSAGLSLYQAVLAGEGEATAFFQEWEAEVRAGVPEDRRLEFRVQEGWGPLARFLGVQEVRNV